MRENKRAVGGHTCRAAGLSARLLWRACSSAAVRAWKGHLPRSMLVAGSWLFRAFTMNPSPISLRSSWYRCTTYKPSPSVVMTCVMICVGICCLHCFDGTMQILQPISIINFCACSKQTTLIEHVCVFQVPYVCNLHLVAAAIQ